MHAGSVGARVQCQHRALISSLACPVDLSDWRQKPSVDAKVWEGGKACSGVWPKQELRDTVGILHSLVDTASQVLKTADTSQKCQITHTAWQQHLQNPLPVGLPGSALPTHPSRPARPQLVHPKEVPSYRDAALPAAVCMMHGLAHVELNAVELAWDTVARFSHVRLPQAFYDDFAHVADDEARHFGWCVQRLQQLGHDYGAMPAHNLLWENCQLSADSVVARMCVIPMAQEARGLDAGPRLVQRLRSMGDPHSAALVAQIAQEEVAHVAVGVYWLQAICALLGLPARETFQSTMATQFPDVLKGPFNEAARGQAGLTPAWYDPAQWKHQEASGSPPSMDKQQLRHLHQRLAGMLATEMACSA